jgi:hypothetical protein
VYGWVVGAGRRGTRGIGREWYSLDHMPNASKQTHRDADDDGVGVGTGRTFVLCRTDSFTIGLICSSRSVSMVGERQAGELSSCDTKYVGDIMFEVSGG